MEQAQALSIMSVFTTTIIVAPGLLDGLLALLEVEPRAVTECQSLEFAAASGSEPGERA